MKSYVKHEHHTVPAFYLKGFVIRKGEKFIWVYKRGQQFKPAAGEITPNPRKEKNNPYKDTIRRACVERDFYANPNAVDKEFEFYENQLELLERPAISVLTKIRSLQTISSDEKRELA